MSKPHSCLACGHEGFDVAIRLVEVDLAEQRVVGSAIPINETNRGVATYEYVEVRERFIAEPRCRDARACQERIRAFTPQPPIAVAAAIEEDDEWLG